MDIEAGGGAVDVMSVDVMSVVVVVVAVYGLAAEP